MNIIPLYKDTEIYSSFYIKSENIVVNIGFSMFKNISSILCAIQSNDSILPQCNISYDVFNKVDSSFFVLTIHMSNSFKLEYIHLNSIQIKPYIIIEENIRYNCTLCITKFINYTSHTYLLEAISSYLLIGIDHIVIYYLSSSSQVLKLLEHFRKKRIVDIIKWNFTYETTNLKKYIYGQIWKYNDCYYRYKHSSNLMLFNDIDEVLWSDKYITIKEITLKEQYKEADVLYFYNRLFRKEFYSNNGYNNSRLIPYDRHYHYIPDFSMFSYHNSCLYRKGYYQKYIIRNHKKIKFIGIHDIRIVSSKINSKYIDSKYVFIRHTRRVREDLLRDCKNWTDYYSDKEKYIQIAISKSHANKY